MKIISGNELYLQKSDIEVALKDKEKMPREIRDKLNERMAKETERSEGVFLLFEDASILEYFRNLDYVLDYNLMKNLSWSESLTLCEKALIELNGVDKSSKEGLDEENYNIKIALLKHKLETIKFVIQSKKGKTVVGSSENTKAKKKIFDISKMKRK